MEEWGRKKKAKTKYIKSRITINQVLSIDSWCCTHSQHKVTRLVNAPEDWINNLAFSLFFLPILTRWNMAPEDAYKTYLLKCHWNSIVSSVDSKVSYKDIGVHLNIVQIYVMLSINITFLLCFMYHFIFIWNTSVLLIHSAVY